MEEVKHIETQHSTAVLFSACGLDIFFRRLLATIIFIGSRNIIDKKCSQRSELFGYEGISGIWSLL